MLYTEILRVSERLNYFNSYLEIFFIFIQQAVMSWRERLFLQLLITVLRLLILYFRFHLYKGLLFLTGDSGISEAFLSICFCYLKR